MLAIEEERERAELVDAARLQIIIRVIGEGWRPRRRMQRHALDEATQRQRRECVAVTKWLKSKAAEEEDAPATKSALRCCGWQPSLSWLSQ